MSIKDLCHHVLLTYKQAEELTETLQNLDRFDTYAYFMLRTRLHVSHDDAFEFGHHFRLIATDGKPKSMDESLLMRGIHCHKVSIAHIIEFEESKVDKVEVESGKIALRNAYLSARCARVCHELAMTVPAQSSVN